MLPFNPCISLLHIISCVLHVCLLWRCFSPDFKCYLNVIFEHYLKIGKESAFGALRSHEMLPPRPFSATSKKKIRKTPVRGTVQRPQFVGNTPALPLLLAAHADPLLVPNSPIWGAGGSRVEQGCTDRGDLCQVAHWGPSEFMHYFKDMPCVRCLLVTVDSVKIVQIVPIYEDILPHSTWERKPWAGFGKMFKYQEVQVDVHGGFPVHKGKQSKVLLEVRPFLYTS